MGLTQTLSDGTNTYIYGNGRIAQMDGTATEYFLTDALGSVRQLTGSSGAITYARAYDPYGVVTTASGTSGTPYGYTGEYTSNDLVYLRSRHYDPAMGRFLTRDTWMGDVYTPITYNRWVYAHGNPVRYRDPSGKDPISECVALFATLAVIDGPIPAGDTAGLIACAVIFLGGSYTALYVTQQTPNIQQDLGQCTNTWEYLYTRVSPEPKLKRGPIKVPWWPIDNDNEKRKIKHISLGLEEVGTQLALRDFTFALNAVLNKTMNTYVYRHQEWFEVQLTDEPNPANFQLQFTQATQRASLIHFNLQGIIDPVTYAEIGKTGFGDSESFFTAAELYQIKENPALCQKTFFYKDASRSLAPSQSIKKLLCSG